MKTIKIPIRNIWLLLLYASEFYQKKGFKKFKVEDNPDEIPDLIAEILIDIVERRIKRNLTYGYQDTEEVVSRIKGRINFLRTERNLLLLKGKVACKYEKFTINTPRNRYVRAALLFLSKITTDKTLSIRCKVLANTLKNMGVIGEKPNSNILRSERYSIYDSEDRIMVSVAKLAFSLALPTEEIGSKMLPISTWNEPWLRQLFEKAIGGFYKVVLSNKGWRVKTGHKIKWPVEYKTEKIDEILPSMKTDIILEKLEKNERIVIDTKFTAPLTTGYYRDKSLKSAYLYQIYTYLRTMESSDDPYSLNAKGMLIYPVVDNPIDEMVIVQNHPIRFVTIDLTQEPKMFRNQLLNIIDFGI